MMSADLPRYFSPKRKREPSESDFYSPSASPTSTVSACSLQEARLREDIELGRQSPRAAVTGRFGELAIRGDRFPEPLLQRDFHQEPTPQSSQEKCPPESHLYTNTMPETLSTHNAELREVRGHQPPTEQSTEISTESALAPTTLSPSKNNSAPSPRKQHTPISPSKNRKQRRSPPLADVSSKYSMTWHDDEITGHNPTDPTDDGYGINGVGFKPTAAMAAARSHKRQKQVAEWKTREARDAREKRRARRNEDIALEKIHRVHHGAIQKRVKFDI
ncbi:hypothetical protein N7448_006825 [Penicillium atrosanguineum]|uniref:Uncharacterized protein n=1 Tax=Penicillium atrosanguineum TaxID=1132637 RepID=A0A9W9PSD7_9EURO|nr:uncharacterized protein N7443_010586 [Penicillium atrosanguineum]KAJ5132667.1 hypothetical protein N7448_006825 [Penicillium atrosanguineum]KAJ5141448.1 hypothetical protein N7526_002443 [Penicillium atrosanguineum]KAJ5290333.1 hypothetical protein N7443_010586 [Penicillium atrosanguineum]KAJ5308156.1 hypothetical protein N7476_008812 [Penicillium atrosanguineum]